MSEPCTCSGTRARGKELETICRERMTPNPVRHRGGTSSCKASLRTSSWRRAAGSGAERQGVRRLRRGVVFDGAALVPSAGLSGRSRRPLLAEFRPVACDPERAECSRVPTGEGRSHSHRPTLAAARRANSARCLTLQDSISRWARCADRNPRVVLHPRCLRPSNAQVLLLKGVNTDAPERHERSDGCADQLLAPLAPSNKMNGCQSIPILTICPFWRLAPSCRLRGLA